MHNFGETRSSRQRNHLLQTPDTFVRTPLPGIKLGSAVVHVSPAAGAQFTQYTVELDRGGSLASAPSPNQRFLYVLWGHAELRADGLDCPLQKGSYAYLPPATPHSVLAIERAAVAVIEKPYSSLAGIIAPHFFAGHEDQIAPHALNGDSGVQVRTLIPEEVSFDFAVNTMTYQPGASLPMVEVHVMEHGLLMLEGGGVYRLADCWYPTAAGDFVWMAPFCPQWFGALGKTPTKYLIYKDWNRHPLA